MLQLQLQQQAVPVAIEFRWPIVVVAAVCSIPTNRPALSLSLSTYLPLLTNETHGRPGKPGKLLRCVTLTRSSAQASSAQVEVKRAEAEGQRINKTAADLDFV